MSKVTTRAGGADGTSHICKTFPPVCCSSTHFVHTIKGKKVVKILNTGLKGRPVLILKEISAVYNSDHACKIASGVNIQQNSSSILPLGRRAIRQCQRACGESDTESGIGLDDYVFTKMTLNDLKNSLGKAKKKQKVLGVSAEFYSESLTEHLDKPECVKDESCELEESLSCYIVKVKKTKSKGQKHLSNIRNSFPVGTGEEFLHEKNTGEQELLNGIKREILETDWETQTAVVNSDHSAPELTCSGHGSTECRNGKDLCNFNRIKMEVELDYWETHNGFYSDVCSSTSCSGDVNLSAKSAEKGEEECEDHTQEFTSVAEKTVCLSTGMPETVNEAGMATILQTSLKDNLHACATEACTDYLPSSEHVTNLTNTDESRRESEKMDTLEMTNLKPVFSESMHEKDTMLKVVGTCSSEEGLSLIRSVIDQQLFSTENQSITCMESNEESHHCEVEASSVGDRKDCLQVSLCMKSNEKINEHNKDRLAGVVLEDSTSHSGNCSVGAMLMADGTCSSEESLSLIRSVIDQQLLSTEYQSIMCMKSNEKNQHCEMESSSDGNRMDCLQVSVCMKSNEKSSEHDKDILAGVVLEDSNSHSCNCSMGEIHVPNGFLQANFSLLDVSNSFDDTSSSFGEISQQTVVRPVYPAGLFASDASSISKATESPEHNYDSKSGKRPKRLLSARKMISPTSQKRLRQAMDIEELNSMHLSGLSLEETGALNAFNIENKSSNSLNGSPPLLKNGVLRTPDRDCSSAETDAQKAIRFSQRQMHDIESLTSKLLRKLKCMKNIVEEILTACPSMPSRYTDEEIRNAIESANALEDGAGRLLAMMARDCNRFCKIMNSSGKKGNHVCVAPKERKKIVFADEAGGQLCHVKVFEST